MKWRYDVKTSGRFPADFEARCAALRNRSYLATVHFNGPFWQLREWLGMEGLCVMMADNPDLVMEMCRFWAGFVSHTLARILERVELDAVGLSEDMAYKAHSMISPAMARRFLKPCYDRWAPQIKAGGCPIIDMDSDGYIGELIPIWIESGINVCDPIEVAAHNDIREFRRRFGRAMAFRGGIDKRCMARGGKALAEEFDRVAPVCRDGGYIPGCDHGIPPDVSWENYLDYGRRLARLTGWM
jgi:uroporphyrinogen-III decarboxylase